MTIPPEINHDLQSNEVEAEVKSATSEVQENSHPKFGPRPDTNLNYFEDEAQRLPLTFNLGDTPLSKEQQD